MKKFFLAAMLIIALITNVCLAEGMVVVDDAGYVKLEGESISNLVTVVVARDGFDILGEDANTVIDEENIVFSGEVPVGSGYKYSVEFCLNDNGAYTAYIGSTATDLPETVDILHVKKTAYDTALAELKRLKAVPDEAGFKSYFKNNTVALGLVRDIFAEVDKEAAAAVLFNSGELNEDVEGFINNAEKAAAAVLLNDNTVNDLTEYAGYLHIEDESLNKHLSEDLYAEIKTYISGKGISDISGLDALVSDAIIIASVNQAESGQLESILKDFAGKIGIDAAKVTSSLCSAIVLKEDFSSVQGIKEYINGYKEPAPAPGGGGGGGGGGGTVGNITTDNKFDGTTAVIEPETNKEEFDVFKDLAGVEWAKEAITQLSYMSVVNGKTDDLFYPNDNVLREEFAKMITTAFSMNLVDNEFPFADVKNDDWCYKYVKTAYLAGITKGISETLFGKGQMITRQDLCVMVYNALKAGDKSIPAGVVKSFTDEEKIADYAKEAIRAMCAANIVNGFDDGSFNPTANATRAEAAKIIYTTISCME